MPTLRAVTWAIAMPGFPTGAVLLADVRVTWVDERSGQIVQTVDGVLKVHPVARNLAVAFAGSVVAGFMFVHAVARSLAPAGPDYLWSPAWVAWRWHRRLRRAWRELPSDVRAGGCELLLVGSWPSSTHPAFAHSDAYRLVAPNFELSRLPRGRASAIGSGTGVQPYVEMLDSFADDWHELVQFSIQPFPGGPAGPMSAVLGQLVADHPDPTVSTQFVFCLVTASKTSIHTVTSPQPGLSTPPLARTLSEFERLCRDRGLTAAAATGSVGRPRRSAAS